MYLALYRKYRPQTFADVISQPHITRTLQNQVSTGQTAHAYLFTGSRGTGKTTCAKILAKAVNCTNPVDGNPCLECEACKLIEEGVSDIMEIDAASNNGVDDVRALRDEVMYSPVSCKYRVYIIDEVHMLSINAFNALLKTIEEPPAHVIFILATTESHKVPATILSRCQRFEFHRIEMKDSAQRLIDIAQKENASLDESAALLISRLSDGGMRDALSLLDQCISVNSKVTSAIVRECAGIAGREHLFGIADCVLKADSAGAIEIVDTLHRQSKDLGRLIDELIFHFRNLMLMKLMPHESGAIDALPDEMDLFERQCEKFSLPQIMRCLDILENCFEQLGRTRQRKILAEMCVIRLCTPRLDTGLQAMSNRISKLEAKLSGAEVTIAPAAQEAPEKPITAEITEPMPSGEAPVSEQALPVSEEPSLLDQNLPIAQWNEIIEQLPPYLSGTLDGSKAYLNRKTVLIKGSIALKGILENAENLAELKSVISETLSSNCNVKYYEEETVSEEREPSPMEKFLENAKAQGVKIITKQA